jgi:hypothetical protein
LAIAMTAANFSGKGQIAIGSSSRFRVNSAHASNNSRLLSARLAIIQLKSRGAIVEYEKCNTSDDDASGSEDFLEFLSTPIDSVLLCVIDFTYDMFRHRKFRQLNRRDVVVRCH